MRKRKQGGRELVELIGETIKNSRMTGMLKEKLKDWLMCMGPRRIRKGCLMVLAMMCIGDVVLICTTEPSLPSDYPLLIIRGEAAVRAKRQAAASAFSKEWDRLMMDTAMKRSWEALVKIRPGLADTLQHLRGMDSAEIDR
jgi:hypothetical protein